MSLKITDLVDKSVLDNLESLRSKIGDVKTSYTEAATELAKGLKVNVEVTGDIEKLSTIISASAKKAGDATGVLNEAMKKQAELANQVAKSLDEQAKKGDLSQKEMDKLTASSKKNAESLEKLAKGEAALEKARNSGSSSAKKNNLTEEERIKIIKDALALSTREVHSINEANEANKKLREAVKLVRDTDEDYQRTLGKLNSTIGINTDYVKRNSDRYTQQKMTIGDYKEQMKLAWVEIQNGNVSMKNMGIVAGNMGNILKSKVSSGFKEVGASVGTMMKGFIGAQAAIKAIQVLFGAIGDGVKAALHFETANSKLAAILGTTASKTIALQLSARELGATTRYTAEEATNLQIELAKLGFTANEIKESTKYVLRFAQATGAELPEAASLSGAALRMFNASTQETERYVSSMAVATSRSALSFSYLATALPIVGPVANAFNFTIEDTLALLGKLADSGFDASMAATATRNIFLNLADSSGKLAKELGKPVTSLPELVEGLQKLRDKGIDLNSTLELTDKRSVAAFNAFLTSADKIMPLREQITGVEGELKDMADEMQNNVEGAMKGFSSVWEEMMITISRGKGVIKDIIDSCADGIRWLTDLLSTQEEIDAKRKAKTGEDALSYAKESMKSEMIAINRLKETYIKAGDDETKALEKAKAHRLAAIKDEYDKQKKLMDDTGKENQKLHDQMNNASLVKQGLFLEKSNSQYKKEINQTWEQYLKYYKNVTSLEEQMKQISDIAPDKSDKKTHLQTDSEKNAAEKAAKEALKIDQAYEDSKLGIMKDGYEKEIAQISLNYNKKIAAVKGNSEKEKQTRLNLSAEMEQKIADFKKKYELDVEKKNLDNRIAAVDKGSKKELDLQLKKLELLKKEQIDNVNKTGEDTTSIEEKYNAQRIKLYEDYANKQVSLISERYAAEQSVRDAAYLQEAAALKQHAIDTNMKKEEYDEQLLQLAEKYAENSARAVIKSLEEQISVENLSDKQRLKLAEQLQKAKAELVDKEADNEIKAQERIVKAEEKTKKQRERNLKQLLRTASQTIGAIGDLMYQMYANQIKGIEDQQDANQDAYDKDVERIEQLNETGAISDEEAEARKRAAKVKSEKKDEELAKKKADLAYKQALWDKATSISQAGIATALAITEALPNIVLAALVGVMGAAQIATIVATPIQAYAKGTDNHNGGLAMVGDGGKSEVVTFNGKAWITPDTPVVVDLPKGAKVFPDASKFDMSGIKMFTDRGELERNIIVKTNNSGVEKRLEKNNYLLMRSIVMQQQLSSDLRYSNFKSKI